MVSATPMDYDQPAPMAAPMARHVCPRCGATIYPGDVACQLCGYFFGSDDDDNEQPPAGSAPPRVSGRSGA